MLEGRTVSVDEMKSLGLVYFNTSVAFVVAGASVVGIVVVDVSVVVVVLL